MKSPIAPSNFSSLCIIQGFNYLSGVHMNQIWNVLPKMQPLLVSNLDSQDSGRAMYVFTKKHHLHIGITLI